MKKNNDALPNDDIVLLEEAFKQFNITTQRLREAYGTLEDRFAELNVELARKNRELEKSLEENKTIRFFLHNLIENMPVGVVFVDLSFAVTMFNPYADSVFGFKESSQGFLAHTQTMLRGVVSSDGARHDFDIDYNNKILKMNMTPIKSGTALVDGILVTFQDVTHERALEEDLRKKNTYEVLGEMSAIMAHEFKTPLAGIEGFLALLKRDVKEQPNLTTLVEKITQGTRHLTQIVSELLTFTRPLHPEFEIIDVRNEITGVITEIVHDKQLSLLNESESIEWSFDRMLFRQMMFNVISNAIDAVDAEKGLITIKALIRNTQLHIICSDNGCGMSSETVKSIFQPFFTQKAHGTGLGLSFVWRIVDIHNGEVAVESEQGKGTVFTFVFNKVE